MKVSKHRINRIFREIQQKQYAYHTQLANESIKAMSKGEVLNTAKSWELKGKIELISQIYEMATNENLDEGFYL